ncbi:MAG: glutamine-synthetase adenylyltransferase, partial [Hyphomonadaceae bacterium]
MTERLEIIGIQPLVPDPSDWRGALDRAAPLSDHIARMVMRRGDAVEQLVSEGPDAAVAAALAEIHAAAEAADGIDPSMRRMRRAKEAAQLAISAVDLSGGWAQDKVLEQLTALADASVQSALRLSVREGWKAGWFDDKRESDELPGLFVLAMGKMGARELNYSSDIDLIVLFDLDILPIKGLRVKEAMTRVTRSLVRILDERTVDGYVFRTDLRLRPDPGSTSPAVSTQFAHGYYESVGQNWERMAHIKARVCAGDMAAGDAYLEELSPYIWRRHLDYWAIADVHSIKRQIHALGGHAELQSPDFDVKLGRGGIREIEFFAQT